MKHKHLFVVVAATSLVLMIPLTLRAISVRGVFDNAHLMKDVWFQVTLVDAYLAFLSVWVFVCLIEKSLMIRILWLVLFLCFGSMAIAAYLLLLSRRPRISAAVLAGDESDSQQTRSAH